jgi:hypothetical protein
VIELGVNRAGKDAPLLIGALDAAYVEAFATSAPDRAFGE